MLQTHAKQFMQLRTLLAALEQPPQRFCPDSLDSQIEITGLAYDSRKVETGSLFVAVPGVHTDGRFFLDDVARRGARVALGEAVQDPQHLPLPYIEVQDVRTALANLSCAFYDYPAQHLCTIGVTGTDGKTTTCNLIHTILESAGRRSGLMTTANFKLSDRKSVV